jgi:hypothetical protein
VGRSSPGGFSGAGGSAARAPRRAAARASAHPIERLVCALAADAELGPRRPERDEAVEVQLAVLERQLEAQ